MKFVDTIEKNRILVNVKAQSKKKSLEHLSELLASAPAINIKKIDIFEALIAREKMGSTNIGDGVAIPHARIKGLQNPVGAIIHLQDEIVFDEKDDEPIYIIFGIIVPDKAHHEHLELLSSITSIIKNHQDNTVIKNVASSNDLYQLISSD